MIWNKHFKCSDHSVQWGINERFGEKTPRFIPLMTSKKVIWVTRLKYLNKYTKSDLKEKVMRINKSSLCDEECLHCLD